MTCEGRVKAGTRTTSGEIPTSSDNSEQVKKPGEAKKKKKNLLHHLWHMAHCVVPLPLSNSKLVTSSTNTALQKGRRVTSKAGSSLSLEHSYLKP